MPNRRSKPAPVRNQIAEQQKWFLISGGLAGAVFAFAFLMWSRGMVNPLPNAVSPTSSPVACSAVQTLPSQGATHIKPNDPHPPYNTNPPNSGWHWENPQEWGIYTTAQVQEQLVHNLEHGGIIVQYNALSAGDVERLTNLVKRDAYHMILAPYPGLPADVTVALTAWTHLQTCNGVDETALLKFVNAYRDQGPERVP
ncbi:hypothetical protein ANRL1_03562 [Anaerolineae bacterium]|nr:hypothetical protein ANRL1_03562 [Anaerolineae bacterium]